MSTREEAYRAAIQRLESGQSWAEFCDSLKAAGSEVFDAPADLSAFDRAEGYRYLTRLLRGALETFIEYADPQAPELRRTCHETIKMGADNPDNVYLNAPLNGKYEYRLYGNRGTVHDLGFGIQEGNYGSTGSLPTTAYLDINDLEVDADGNFELLLSQREQPGNWLPLRPQSRVLNVRQTLSDHDTEILADLKIERTDGRHAPRPVSPVAIDKGLQGAAAFVGGCAKLFNRWAANMKHHPNQLPLFDPKQALAAGGVPHIAYYHGFWELAEDEALIIEATPPNCHFWNFQLDNWWMESLDYRYFDVWLNNHSAELEADGSVRIVVAHSDPGVSNWMDTCNHDKGTMCLRWVHADEHPTPRTRVVKLSEIKNA